MTLHYDFKTFRDYIPAAEIARYKADYKNIADKISFQLFGNITPGGSSQNQNRESSPSTISSTSVSLRDWQVCWPAIWLTFFFSLLFSRLFVWLNSRSEETFYAPGSGYPLGGWLLLLGISIAGILLTELVMLWVSSYYSNSQWIAYGKLGGPSLQYLVLSELALRLTFIAGSGSLLFWFFKRRDIFPRMFLWYAGLLLTGSILLLALSYSAPGSRALAGNRPGLTQGLIMISIYAAIWVSYILRSGQVKSTFLEPYRERIR
jgi:hypothetical protein